MSKTSVYDQSNQRYLVNYGAGSGESDVIFDGTPKSKVKSLWITGASRQFIATKVKRYYQAARDVGDIVADGFDVTPPADSTFTVNSVRLCGGIPRLLVSPTCQKTIYELMGKCGKLDNLYDAETDYALIYEHAEASGPQTFTDGSNQVSGEALIDTEVMTAEQVYFAGKLLRQNKVAGGESIIDVIYYHDQKCCKSKSLIGNEWIATLSYGLTDNILSYTTDRGDTWTDIALAGGTGRNSVGLAKWGSNIVIISHGSNHIAYLPILKDGSLGAEVVVLDDVAWGNPTYIYGDDDAVVAINPSAQNVIFITDPISGKYYYSSYAGTTGSDVRAITRSPCGRYVLGFEESGLPPSYIAAYSDDAGITWVPAPISPPPYLAGDGAHKIIAWASECWDIGFQGDPALWRTTDAGQSWRLIDDTFGHDTGGMVRLTPSLSVYTTFTELGGSSLQYSLDEGSTVVASTQGWRFDQQIMPASTSQLVNGILRGAVIATPHTKHPDLMANEFVVAGNTTDGPYLYIYTAIMR